MYKTVAHRFPKHARFILFVSATLLCSVNFLFAQTVTPRPLPPRVDSPSNDRRSDERQLGTFEEELRAKRAIRMAEKEHEENLNRARELAQVAKELQAYLKDKTTLDRVSLKKIDRLEKLAKKIRGEAGGEDEEIEIIDRPTDISSAAKQIAESAESLSKNVQNTPRQVVSASVIGNANVLLELIKLIRAFAPRS